MKITEIHQNEDLYQKALKLRYELFFKEHSLPQDILIDTFEATSTHIAISQGQELIAYGRLSSVSPQQYQISQMVVSPNYQRQGYGSKLLTNLIATAKNNGAASIILNARTTAISLYYKHNFKQIGEVFISTSTGVPHIKMVHNVHT